MSSRIVYWSGLFTAGACLGLASWCATKGVWVAVPPYVGMAGCLAVQLYALCLRERQAREFRTFAEAQLRAIFSDARARQREEMRERSGQEFRS